MKCFFLQRLARGLLYFHTILFSVFALTLSLEAQAVLSSPYPSSNDINTQWQKYLPTLIECLHELDPISTVTTPPPINAASSVFSLNVPEEISIKLMDEKEVKQISVVVHYGDLRKASNISKELGNRKIDVIVTFGSGEKKRFNADFPKLPSNAVTPADYLMHLILALGGVVDNSHMYWPRGDTNNESKNEHNYNQESLAFYLEHRNILGDLMVDALAENKQLDQQTKTHGAYLFFLGCGSGHDVNTFSQKFNTKGIAHHSTGVELEPDLVALGKKQYPQYNFICGNALNAKAIIQDETSQRKLPGAPVLVIAEGLLTWQVLDGPYQSLQILQALIQEGVADMVVLGGLSMLQINTEVASAAGWKASAFTPNIPPYDKKHISSLILLERRQDEDLFSHIRARSIARDDNDPFSALDLSMSGNPLAAIEHFLSEPEANNITQLDLSWSYLTNEQVTNQLFTLIRGFPNLKELIFSGFEPWNNRFSDQIKASPHYALLKRTDNQYPYDLPTYEPAMARLLGQHQKSPPTEIAFETSKKSLPIKQHAEHTQWTEDIAASSLPPQALKAYQDKLLTLLSQANLQLISSTGDGLCAFHSIAMQLGISTGALRSSMLNYVQESSEFIQNQIPALSGETLGELESELSQGAWGDEKIAPVIAQIYGKRVIVIWATIPNADLHVSVFNPDGTGSDVMPDDLSGDDLYLIHSGYMHWVGAMYSPHTHDLLSLNEAVLQQQFATPSPVEASKRELSISIMMTLLSVLLVRDRSSQERGRE